MQATVYRYDPDTGSGSVLTDDGVVLPFTLEALRLSGLRHLRPGQRLTVTQAPGQPDDQLAGADSEGSGGAGRITQLTLGSIGAALRAQQG